ncbi:hypothetical protein [Desulfogranum marinum]|uniref:hypothetical protein n=1 Tax=Desulfogranum marinum TaxID=453220 RepID=UPI0029C6DD3E|nr:hypothetical protein [Desulfogranum marinum]
MEEGKLFDLYEKLYFHEVEAREKLSARMQIPLAISLAILGVIANIIKGLSFSVASVWCYVFWLVFGASVVLFVFALKHFVRSFYGHAYQFLPPANETERYRLDLIETYKGYEEGEVLSKKYFNQYIYNYYNECSSVNTAINDSRSEALHKCNTYLILCALPLAIAFLTFTFSGVDKNSVDKEYKVKITNSFKLPQNIQLDSSEKNEQRTAGVPEGNQEEVLTNGKRTTETSATTSSPPAKEGDKGGRRDPEAETTQTTKT